MTMVDKRLERLEAELHTSINQLSYYTDALGAKVDELLSATSELVQDVHRLAALEAAVYGNDNGAG